MDITLHQLLKEMTTRTAPTFTSRPAHLPPCAWTARWCCSTTSR